MLLTTLRVDELILTYMSFATSEGSLKKEKETWSKSSLLDRLIPHGVITYSVIYTYKHNICVYVTVPLHLMFSNGESFCATEEVPQRAGLPRTSTGIAQGKNIIDELVTVTNQVIG